MQLHRLLLISSLCFICSCLDVDTQLKRLHHSESIKHLGSTISLRLYDNLKDSLLSSLEIINVEDIYEQELKVAQAIHIVTYYYDLSVIDKDRFLKPIEHKHNKAFASLISNNEPLEKRVLNQETIPTVITGDHGFQDGVNNNLFDPVVNVIAQISGNKLQIRGTVIDYREGLTGDDMLEDNFQIEAEIPFKQREPVANNNMAYFYLLSFVTILIYLFVINSDIYNSQ